MVAMVEVMAKIVMVNKVKVVGIKVKVAGVRIMEILVMVTMAAVVVVQFETPITAIEVKDHMEVNISKIHHL